MVLHSTQLAHIPVPRSLREWWRSCLVLARSSARANLRLMVASQWAAHWQGTSRRWRRRFAAPLAVAAAATLSACASDSGQPLTPVVLADGDTGSTVNAEV